MNILNSQMGCMTYIDKDKVIVNGKEYSIPDKVKIGGMNQTVIDGDIYINGYEFKNGEWKKTLKALFYKWF